MKHTAVINFERATCSCGQMPGIWRRDGETIGDFTKRAYRLWEQHAHGAQPAATLFEMAPEDWERDIPAQGGLFAA
jgi:hypothetical protein